MLEEEALLGKIALKRGILNREQLKECLRLRRRGGKVLPLVAVLVEKGYVSDQELDVILADQRRILEKRQQSKRVKKKLRESQIRPPARPKPRAAAPAAPPEPLPEADARDRVRIKNESVEIEHCRYCGKPVPVDARRCQHCGKRLYPGGEESRLDRRRAKSDFLCNICLYPVFETESECPSCHAVFLKPGEGGEFKCSQCMRFVSEHDTVCPWCRAVFT